jgi:two-component system phosphate regulon sensor histidine kinase PhoR
MSLKKLLPLILVLITISLVGTIYMQYNRLQNLLIIKEEQLYDRIAQSIDQVADEISSSRPQSLSLRQRRRSPLNLGNSLMSTDLIPPQLVAERFTQFEIREKLDAAFKRNNVQLKTYEFAVTNNLNLLSYEMYSPGFLAALADTVANKQWVYLLEPPAGTWAEGLAPYESIIVIVPDFSNLVFSQSYFELIVSVLFILFIMFAFVLTVRTMLNQRKLNEIKSDFINNMTHEFKTPLATISLAVDALANEKVLRDESKLHYFRNIIKDENKRMNKHVETILQAASLEKQELTLNKKKCSAHEIVQHVVDNYKLVLQEKQGHATLQLSAKNDEVFVDEQHFTNLVNNLIDNAIKYSKEKPELTITTHSSSRYFILQVADRGIGMSKETVKRIFEKFYRAHTGNIHNVKGFGLGMTYVKNIVDAHKGRIKVESALGKGSTFTVEIPLAKG